MRRTPPHRPTSTTPNAISADNRTVTTSNMLLYVGDDEPRRTASEIHQDVPAVGHSVLQSWSVRVRQV